MIRKIDELGRIVIPKEYREILNIQSNSCITMIVEGNKIIMELAKDTLKCDACGHLCSMTDKFCSQCGKQL